VKRLFMLMILPLVIAIGISLMPSTPVHAAVNLIGSACDNANAAKKPTVCGENGAGGSNPLFGPGGILTTVVQILTIIIGIASVFTIIIAGLRMIVSNGDSNTINVARNAIIYAAAGLAITAAAQAIVTFVLSRIGT